MSPFKERCAAWVRVQAMQAKWQGLVSGGDIDGWGIPCGGSTINDLIIVSNDSKGNNQTMTGWTNDLTVTVYTDIYWTWAVLPCCLWYGTASP
jgi:hypothetical protein